MNNLPRALILYFCHVLFFGPRGAYFISTGTQFIDLPQNQKKQVSSSRVMTFTSGEMWEIPKVTKSREMFTVFCVFNVCILEHFVPVCLMIDFLGISTVWRHPLVFLYQ